MLPFAYGLREHPVFQTPHSIDVTRTIDVKQPRAWRGLLPGDTVTVFPIVDDHAGNHPTGWSAETTGFAELPEVEVMCGAINTKRPTAAALWRQGNLLYFNFEQNPKELNAAGRDLLENSIRYIARFTEDRPIAFTPSPRTGAKTPPVRPWLARTLHADFDGDRLPSWFGPPACAVFEKEGEAGFLAWFDGVRGSLHPDAKGKLIVDPDISPGSVANRDVVFVEYCVRALTEKGETADRARRLLARYVPTGPKAEASAETWATWFDEHRPYLFFTDLGGYVWLIDPLAKARGVPTAELRGPARADR